MMMPKFVLLPTDIVVIVLVAALGFYLWHALRSDELRARWRYVMGSAAALCSADTARFFPFDCRFGFGAFPSGYRGAGSARGL